MTFIDYLSISEFDIGEKIVRKGDNASKTAQFAFRSTPSRSRETFRLSFQ